MSKPILQVIICSTRPGRVGGAVGHWFANVAREQGDFDVQVADLAEINLPFMDEPNHPNQQKYTHEHTKEWAKRIEASDAIVLVTPEYNFGMNAQAKNALDYLYWEWTNKPLGFVSYGGASGGIRAVQMLKQVTSTLLLCPVRATVSIPYVGKYVSDDKQTFNATEDMLKAADAMLAELAKAAPVLGQLRA